MYVIKRYGEASLGFPCEVFFGEIENKYNLKKKIHEKICIYNENKH